jgi:type II secretory pathway pseudopilin PulG
MLKALKSIHPLKKTSKKEAGFTLIEVAIAGAILASILTAVAQISTRSMAASKNLSSRQKMEDAINNDIQLLQKSDSYLVLSSLSESEKIKACDEPNSYLIDYLEEEVPKSRVSSEGVTRDIQAGVGETEDVIEVIYEFRPPENNVSKEYRRIEINPNFSALCYTI